MKSGAIGKAVSNIHTNVQQSLKYIVNTEKTEKQLLVSGLNCYEPEDYIKTSQEFKDVQNKFLKNNKKNTILAHHYLISFDPKDGLDEFKAHELSKNIMERFLKNQHQAVLSTHIDKENHIHTHVIFNSYNKNTGLKYESSPEKLREFKEIINEVCLNNELALININNDINLNYKDWMKDENRTEGEYLKNVEYIKSSINSVFKDHKVKNIDDLAYYLKKSYGIDSKYKSKRNYGDKKGKLYKHITFKCDGWGKGIRGKYDISLENLINRVHDKNIINNKYEEFCSKSGKTSYKSFIKDAIDNELKNNLSVENIEDLAKQLKEKYNIEMKFLKSNGEYLEKVKFKALGTSQKQYLTAAGVDKENKNNYEIKGLQERISKNFKIDFGFDIRKNLVLLNKNCMLSGKQDKWGISTALNYMNKRNISSQKDITKLKNKINTIKDINDLKIKDTNKYIERMQELYTKLQKNTIQLRTLENQYSKLGIFNIREKKALSKSIDEIKCNIKKLKESEYYQENSLYSDKSKELNKDKKESLEIINRCKSEISVIDRIEKIDINKEAINESFIVDNIKGRNIDTLKSNNSRIKEEVNVDEKSTYSNKKVKKDFDIDL